MLLESLLLEAGRDDGGVGAELCREYVILMQSQE